MIGIDTHREVTGMQDTKTFRNRTVSQLPHHTVGLDHAFLTVFAYLSVPTSVQATEPEPTGGPGHFLEDFCPEPFLERFTDGSFGLTHDVSPKKNIETSIVTD